MQQIEHQNIARGKCVRLIAYWCKTAMLMEVGNMSYK